MLHVQMSSMLPMYFSSKQCTVALLGPIWRPFQAASKRNLDKLVYSRHQPTRYMRKHLLPSASTPYHAYTSHLANHPQTLLLSHILNSQVVSAGALYVGVNQDPYQDDASLHANLEAVHQDDAVFHAVAVLQGDTVRPVKASLHAQIHPWRRTPHSDIPF